MAKQRLAQPIFMAERIARELAKADDETFEANPSRYRRLAIASLKALAVPTEAMIDAAHDAASFDAHWAINSRRDFRRAVRAMAAQAITEAQAIDD
jgi:hypothetical protein